MVYTLSLPLLTCGYILSELFYNIPGSIGKQYFIAPYMYTLRCICGVRFCCWNRGEKGHRAESYFPYAVGVNDCEWGCVILRVGSFCFSSWHPALKLITNLSELDSLRYTVKLHTLGKMTIATSKSIGLRNSTSYIVHCFYRTNPTSKRDPST